MGENDEIERVVIDFLKQDGGEPSA